LIKASSATFSISDNDFTGSVVAVLCNIGVDPVDLKAGESYVQLVPLTYFSGHLVQLDQAYQDPDPFAEDEAAENERIAEFLRDEEDKELALIRGEGGFGSTRKRRLSEPLDGSLGQ
jgi:dUTPase